MIHFLFESVFLTICGWVGHVVVRILTLGRVKLDWSTESESESEAESSVTEAIGIIFLLMMGILVVVLSS